MPIQLSVPIVKTFHLERCDLRYGNEGDPTTVTIRQATQAEHGRRMDLFATLERKWNQIDPDEIHLVQTVSSEEIKRLEVWLTMGECNILDETGNPMFPSKTGKNGLPVLAMNQHQFNETWGRLYPDICEEIQDKVREVNPLWGGDLGEAS